MCKDGEIDVRRVVVRRALHHDVLSKPKGPHAVIDLLRRIAEKD